MDDVTVTASMFYTDLKKLLGNPDAMIFIMRMHFTETSQRRRPGKQSVKDGTQSVKSQLFINNLFLVLKVRWIYPSKKL